MRNLPNRQESLHSSPSLPGRRSNSQSLFVVLWYPLPPPPQSAPTPTTSVKFNPEGQPGRHSAIAAAASHASPSANANQQQPPTRVIPSLESLRKQFARENDENQRDHHGHTCSSHHGRRPTATITALATKSGSGNAPAAGSTALLFLTVEAGGMLSADVLNRGTMSREPLIEPICGLLDVRLASLLEGRPSVRMFASWLNLNLGSAVLDSAMLMLDSINAANARVKQHILEALADRVREQPVAALPSPTPQAGMSTECIAFPLCG